MWHDLCRAARKRKDYAAAGAVANDDDPFSTGPSADDLLRRIKSEAPASPADTSYRSGLDKRASGGMYNRQPMASEPKIQSRRNEAPPAPSRYDQPPPRHDPSLAWTDEPAAEQDQAPRRYDEPARPGPRRDSPTRGYSQPPRRESQPLYTAGRGQRPSSPLRPQRAVSSPPRGRGTRYYSPPPRPQADWGSGHDDRFSKRSPVATEKGFRSDPQRGGQSDAPMRQSSDGRVWNEDFQERPYRPAESPQGSLNRDDGFRAAGDRSQQPANSVSSPPASQFKRATYGKQQSLIQSG